jgi:hypothetical protein
VQATLYSAPDPWRWWLLHESITWSALYRRLFSKELFAHGRRMTGSFTILGKYEDQKNG